jgi:DNA segregation ATPase FtsK/SpoIIIE, S-DNA-T family
VAAVITNLADEAHLVGRMQDAPSGQMNRRQEMLTAAGNFATSRTTTMSARTVTPFLRFPAPFIVVDE